MTNVVFALSSSPFTVHILDLDYIGPESRIILAQKAGLYWPRK